MTAVRPSQVSPIQIIAMYRTCEQTAACLYLQIWSSDLIAFVFNEYMHYIRIFGYVAFLLRIALMDICLFNQSVEWIQHIRYQLDEIEWIRQFPRLLWSANITVQCV